MAKFKVTATLITTSTITRVIDADNRNKATAILMMDSDPKLWKTESTLKTKTN